MRYQPQGLARLRRSVLAGARGIGFVLGSSRSDIFGSAPQLTYFGGTGPALISNQHGLARRFIAGSTNYARVTPAAGLIDLAGSFAVVVAFVLDSTSTGRLLHYSDTVNGLNMQLVSSASGRLGMVVGTGSNQFPNVSSSAQLSTGMPYVMVAGRTPDGYFMYLNGVAQSGSNASIGGLANNIVSADINIGRRGDGSSYFSGQVALFAHIAGTVDAAVLSANPWQLFDDMSDEAEAAAAPAVVHVLSASPVQFALAGADARLRASRLIGASAGQFALTGAAAGLRAARRMAAEPGAFAIAGNPVSVRAARGLATESGVFALAVADAMLRAARRMPASPGAFSLVGGTAALTAARRLSAASGSFAVVGQAAALVHTAAPAPDGPTYLLSAAPGGFSISGAPVALVVARRLAAGGGTFGIAGAPAAIVAQRRLHARPGQFDIAGAAALLQMSRWLPAAAGAFAITGADVTFKHSAQIEYARAPAGSGYTPRRHEYQSRPAHVSTGGRPPANQENYR